MSVMTEDLFGFLLTRAVRAEEIASPSACFDLVSELDAMFASSIDRAAAGGFVADRLGYAFLAGYRAALAALDPALSRASLCATEEGGAHPRAIKTTLAERDGALFLDGHKTFATLASAADVLLVVASRGIGEDGRNRLQIARIPANREGIAIRDRDPIPFAPEIPHARVTFTNVRVEKNEAWEGDGYARVLKPFRTIEDMHVCAAWLGYVVRLTRSSSQRTCERALACIAALRGLPSDPSAPASHIALAGVLAEAVRVAEAVSTPDPRWTRDLPLLAVAQTARELRRDAAWGRIVPPAP